MRKRILSLVFIMVMGICMLSCGTQEKPRIGVSIGTGKAIRWVNEKQYMEERAKEAGVDIEVVLNDGSGQTTQKEEGIKLIDSGIDVLIFTPRDTEDMNAVLDYAREKKVPVITYARAVVNRQADLFVGYDCSRIGQRMGQYLSEMVYQGDYILLRGDENDNNAKLLYDGAMRYINSIRKDINIIMDAAVTGWDPETAKQMVMQAVKDNGGSVDAILAPNDKLAGACADALAELGVTDHVVITGMDAELDAAKRIVAGTQDSTFYMDLRELANIAVDQAIRIAKGETPEINAEFDNQSDKPLDANLITGKLVTKENLDKILIDSGYFSREEVYGDISIDTDK